MKAQLSVELVIIAGVMLFFLFIIYVANQFLQSSWENQKQFLEAGSLANRFALAINRAAAGGNSTKIIFSIEASQSIKNITISGRYVKIYYSASDFYPMPLVTNNTKMIGALLPNSNVIVENREGTIYIYEA
ncbi:MAG: hypothetical protein N3G80_02210 [Candidatus Micrarchaeota archaeon]|nr:hypothetical protein [Candidatus Micrarchaeota archaeon]